MRDDIKPGGRFPDYTLLDHTKTKRRLSDLQSDQTMVLVLTRGAFCPKDRQHFQELVRFHPQLVVGFTHLVAITTDDWHTANNMRQQLGAHFPFLLDENRQVQRDLEIKEYTDTKHDVMIPHTIVLKPGLEIHSVYNGYYYWGRPSMADLHRDLREATRDVRADWDITQADLREAWDRGEKERFWPYGSKDMERTLIEMASAVDQYAGRAEE
jgi:peroxiredoxin|tara:strand:+ start:6701 stop:7336 length:636 start_codon:yes stop_codon:yes gene_type:complete